MNRPALRRTLPRIGGALLLVGVGWFAGTLTRRPGDAAEERRVRLGGFRFVSPLLDVELPEGYGVGREPIPFKYKVKEYVERQLRLGKVRGLSVYYRDLSDGPWFGINEKVTYNPASLMKVPVMIAWLRRAERDPRALEATFVFDEARYPGGPQAIPPSASLVPGHRYTVEELLRHMLGYSDNKAMWLLYNGLRAEELNDVLDSMDVTNDPHDGNNSMTAHGYSGFFRILYNASYLSRAMSEKALQLLSAQEFPQGIVAGVPKGVVVASKFGEFAAGPGGREKQLHEFGIVYHPKGPYILGIMTDGQDLEAQAAILREVSAMIYSELASQPPLRPRG